MTRFNRILAIVLALQIAAIVFLDNPCDRGPYRGEGTLEAAPALFPSFDPEKAASIRIEEGDRNLVLEKDPARGVWEIPGGERRFSADGFLVDALLRSLPRLTRLDRVSSNPKKAAVYGLDEASALKLSVRGADGTEQIRLWVGKNLGALRGTYVKLPGEEDVFLVQENLRRTCDRGEDWLQEWRDKRVCSLDKDRIASICLDGPRGEVIIDHEKGAWTMRRPVQGPLKAWAVEVLEEIFTGLEAKGFSAPGQTPEALGLDAPELSIVVTLLGEASSEEVLMRFSADHDGVRYLMVGDDSATVYKVPSYAVSPLFSRARDLVEGG